MIQIVITQQSEHEYEAEIIKNDQLVVTLMRATLCHLLLAIADEVEPFED
jgi:hypothetical protein